MGKKIKMCSWQTVTKSQFSKEKSALYSTIFSLDELGRKIDKPDNHKATDFHSQEPCQ